MSDPYKKLAIALFESALKQLSAPMWRRAYLTGKGWRSADRWHDTADTEHAIEWLFSDNDRDPLSAVALASLFEIDIGRYRQVATDRLRWRRYAAEHSRQFRRVQRVDGRRRSLDAIEWLYVHEPLRPTGRAFKVKHGYRHHVQHHQAG